MKKFLWLAPLAFLIIIFSTAPQSFNFNSLPYPQYLWILLTGAVFVFFVWIAHKKPVASSSIATIILLCGLLLRIAYLSDTPFSVRGYDSYGHLDYVNYIAKNKSLPSADSCWQCYHPPLYYIISSPICMATQCDQNNAFYLQILSLLFNAGFLFFGIKLLRLWMPEKAEEKYFNLAVALLVFWPSGIIHSVRIGNDPLLYFFMAAGFYFISKWIYTEKYKYLWISILVLIASMFTKSNGVVLFGIICFAVIVRFTITIRAKNYKLFSFLKIFFFLAAIAVLLFGFILFLRPYPGKQPDLKNMLVANANYLPPNLAVENKINNFTYFDFQKFFTVPYANPYDDASGRQYFFNALLKTSLLGEFTFWQDPLQKQALLMYYLFFIILLMTLAGIIMHFIYAINFLTQKKESRHDLQLSSRIIIVPSILLLLVSAMFFRYLYPFSCANDFRYIYPIIIPVVAIIALFIYRISQLSALASKMLEFAAYIFIMSSVIFYASMLIL